MDYIVDGLKKAIELLFSFDKELYGIIFLSIRVSLTATILASVYSIPLGLYLGVKKLRFPNTISRIIYTFMSIPSVIVGLLISILLSRRGPIGFLNLMYTPRAMIIAQTALLTPLLIGLSYGLAKNNGKIIADTCKTLGGGNKETVKMIISELRGNLLINIITGFSRAISEVGAVMIVGGNIKGQTRVITTSISMLNSMGDYPMAIALGLVLIIISFGINSVIYKYSSED
ncbi:MAG: ABC transporter permease [Andreesenia angusta]|nr:ABC transporter permease [Andreesenia angusta]